MGETRLYSLLAQLDDLNQNNNKTILWSKDSKDSTIKQSLIQYNTSCNLFGTKIVEVLPLWTDSCEGSGGSALGETLNKALLISWIGITLYYFRIA